MAEPRWEATLDRILELTVVLGRDMDEELARMGLTGSRAHLVWELVHRGPCKQQVLAGALGVSPRTITALVDGLVATGFVTREPHPTDRRATLITLTARGQTAGQALVDGHRELATQLFAEVPAARLDCFDEVLLGVLARLRRISARA